MTHFDYMKLAKASSLKSKCLRRKIGCVITGSGFASITGVNHSDVLHSCSECKRDLECPAIHAEIDAIMSLPNEMYKAKDLYVYAEVPCLNCLSMIAHLTNITKIYCLHPSYYSSIYPRVSTYQHKIAARKEYAHKLGLAVIELTYID